MATENGLNASCTEIGPTVQGPIHAAVAAAITATAATAIDPVLTTRSRSGAWCRRRNEPITPYTASARIVRPGNSWRSGVLSADVHPHRRTSGDAVTIDVTSALSARISS